MTNIPEVTRWKANELSHCRINISVGSDAPGIVCILQHPYESSRYTTPNSRHICVYTH